MNSPKYSIYVDVIVGEGTRIYDHVNLYKCKIGKNCKIDSYIYIEQDVEIGDDCKVRPFVFIPTGVKIGNRVFIASGVIFTNDKHPKTKGDWKLENTIIEDDVSIGACAVILPGVKVGKWAVIGAGAVVTKDVAPNTTVVGNPAHELKK